MSCGLFKRLNHFQVFNFKVQCSTMEEDPILLRVHSKDLHDHLTAEVADCLETGLFSDVVIRWSNRLVFSLCHWHLTHWHISLWSLSCILDLSNCPTYAYCCRVLNICDFLYNRTLVYQGFCALGSNCGGLSFPVGLHTYYLSIGRPIFIDCFLSFVDFSQLLTIIKSAIKHMISNMSFQLIML